MDIEMSRSLVEHLHKRDFHSSVITKPFVFISCSLLHVARSWIYHASSEEGNLDLRNCHFVTVSRTWKYRWFVFDKNKIRENVTSRTEKL